MSFGALIDLWNSNWLRVRVTRERVAAGGTGALLMGE
jgi:hypothetical protein